MATCLTSAGGVWMDAGSGWVEIGHTDTSPEPATTSISEQIREAVARVEKADAAEADEARKRELDRKITDWVARSLARLRAQADATPGVDTHQKGTVVTLHPKTTLTLGGYRAQVTLDGDTVIWEGGVHGAVFDDTGKRLNDGSSAAHREAADKIESTLTALFAGSETTTKAA